MDSLYQKMQKCALSRAEQTAVVFYGKRYLFKDILSLIDKAAEGLSTLGVKKGSVVTLCMPNTPSAQVAFYALNRIGAIVSLVHPYISAAQLNQSLAHTGSRLLIAYDLFLSKKGGEIDGRVKILKSKSDYFMSGVARLYFKLINRKNKSFSCDIFESLFSHAEQRDDSADFEENQPAVYLPSGGTTSSPKTIAHSCKVFNDLCSHAEFFLSRPLAEYKTMYSVLPIFHGFGLCMNMHMCATMGLKNVMSIKFSPKSMAKAIKKERVNVITGVPAMYEKLLACPQLAKADLSSVFDCFVGGDSASKRLIDEFDAALKSGGSDAKLYEGYGLTETVTVCTVGCKNHNKTGSVGYPLPNTRLKIIKDGVEQADGEVGEICISTPLLMLGYLGENNNLVADMHGESNTLVISANEQSDCVSADTNGENTAKTTSCDSVDSHAHAGKEINQDESIPSPIKIIDGERWLFSGDLGYVDADGFLFFKQRLKSMIKISGIPVFPCEIEEVAESVNGVIRAAAIGIPDSVSGEAVKLFVESKTADPEALKKLILTECKQKLIPYAIPKIIEVRQSLPLNTIGKIDRKKL